jgi:thiamine-phosphate pyrophosphorylase
MRIDPPLVYVITAGAATDLTIEDDIERLSEQFRTAVNAGVDLIQVREKSLSGLNLFRVATAAVQAARNSRTRVLINDRVDVAMAAEADGVHLPSDGFRPYVVRQALSKELMLISSVHSESEAAEAFHHGADAVMFGPIYETPGKAAMGISALRRVCSTVNVPVIAVGGINEENAAHVIHAGAAGVAGIRSFASAETLQTIVDRIHEDR